MGIITVLPLKSEENERRANIKGLEHTGTGVWVQVPTGDAGSTGRGYQVAQYYQLLWLFNRDLILEIVGDRC